MDDQEQGRVRTALVDEATKKSGLVWLTVGDAPARAAWHLWEDGAAYVVCGGTEQPVPGLAEAEAVTVTVRSKDTGGRLLSWTAAVERLDPAGPDWAAVAPGLLAKRLNAADSGTALARWAADCVLCRLVPTGELTEVPALAGGTGSLPTGSLAAPVRPTPASSGTRVPFTLGRWWRTRK